jgi:hypothetical protein
MIFKEFFCMKGEALVWEKLWGETPLYQLSL